MKPLLLLGVASVVALAASDTSKDNAPDSITAVAKSYETGSIVGKVVWKGDRPEPKPALSIPDFQTKGCNHGGSGVAMEDRSLLISNEGGVANVVMTIKAASVKVPSEPIGLDLRGCRFEPRVVVVPVGATLRLGNSDGTSYIIRTFAKKNQAIHKILAPSRYLNQKFDKAEVIVVVCDIHAWMKAFVFVTEASHRSVSGTDGSFKLEGLPPGKYKIEWWHEEVGKGKTEEIEVVSGEITEYIHNVRARRIY